MIFTIVANKGDKEFIIDKKSNKCKIYRKNSYLDNSIKITKLIFTSDIKDIRHYLVNQESLGIFDYFKTISSEDVGDIEDILEDVKKELCSIVGKKYVPKHNTNSMHSWKIEIFDSFDGHEISFKMDNNLHTSELSVTKAYFFGIAKLKSTCKIPNSKSIDEINEIVQKSCENFSVQKVIDEVLNDTSTFMLQVKKSND